MNPRMSGIADVARGSEKHVQQTERGHRRVELRHLLGCQIEVVHADLARLAQNVVVDVGDVAHALRVVTDVAQTALQHVVSEVGRNVADVRRVIRRDAARVHRDRRPGSELDDGLTRRVEQLHGHASMPVRRTAARVL